MEVAQRPALLEKDRNVFTSPIRQPSDSLFKPANAYPALHHVGISTPVSPTKHARKRSIGDEVQRSPNVKRARQDGPLSPALGSTPSVMPIQAGVPMKVEIRQDMQHSVKATQDAEAIHAIKHANDSSQGHESTFSSSTTLVDSIQEPSAAQTLRMRLRYAMFKVRTDQVDADINRLEINVAPPTPKPQLVIREPPEETMRAFLNRESPRQWSGIAPLGRASNDQRSKATRPMLPQRRPQHILELGPEISAAATYGQWNSSPRTRSRVVSPELETEQRVGPYFYANASPAVEPPLHRQDTSSPELIEHVGYLGRGGMRGTERDLTSSAVKDKAADSLLRLGGRV